MPFWDAFDSNSALSAFTQVIARNELPSVNLSTLMAAAEPAISETEFPSLTQFSPDSISAAAQTILDDLNREDSISSVMLMADGAVKEFTGMDVSQVLEDVDTALLGESFAGTGQEVMASGPAAIFDPNSAIHQMVTQAAANYGLDTEVEQVIAAAKSVADTVDPKNVVGSLSVGLSTPGSPLMIMATQAATHFGMNEGHVELARNTISRLSEADNIHDVLGAHSPLRKELMESFGVEAATKSDLLAARLELEREKLSSKRQAIDKKISNEWDAGDNPLSKETTRSTPEIESGFDLMPELSGSTVETLSPKERAEVAVSFGASLADSLLDIQIAISENYGPKTKEATEKADAAAMKIGPKTKEEAESIQKFADGITGATEYLVAETAKTQNREATRAQEKGAREEERRVADEKPVTGLLDKVGRGFTSVGRAISDAARSVSESVADKAHTIGMAVGTVSELGFKNTLTVLAAANKVANDTLESERETKKASKEPEPEPTSFFGKVKAKMSAIGEKIGDAFEKINPHLFDKMEKASQLAEFVGSSVETMSLSKDKPEVGAAIIAADVAEGVNKPKNLVAIRSVQELLVDSPHLAAALKVSADTRLGEFEKKHPETKELTTALQEAVKDPNAASLTKVGAVIANPETQAKLKDALLRIAPGEKQKVEGLQASFGGVDFEAISKTAQDFVQNPNAASMGKMGAAAEVLLKQGKEVVRAASPDALATVERIESQVRGVVEVVTPGVKELATTAMAAYQAPEVQTVVQAGVTALQSRDVASVMDVASAVYGSRDTLMQQGTQMASSAKGLIDSVMSKENATSQSTHSPSASKAAEQEPKHSKIAAKEVTAQAEKAAQERPREMATASSMGR